MCCKWLFGGKKYRDMQEEPKFAVGSPAPRPHMAETIGQTQEERDRRRELAAEQAEKRQDEHLARGVGDSSKVKELQERGQKEELIGRLEEQYARLGEEFPISLRLANLQQRPGVR
ncbi:unnamed protein product [Effrenium voratum]|uniref:Uncharacterized protein n=1 Tax=Effrenium voratum TaxID=2562239 RepID=A0AA36ING5_9DINO|nr:unnamed protein product [Effrenium voratum]